MFRESLSSRDKFDHYVYVMSHITDDWQLANPVKVGISERPARRLKQVRRDVGKPLVLVATFPFWKRSHAYMVEQAFHKACATYRLQGEWFDMTPADAIGVMDKNLREFVSGHLRVLGGEDLYRAYDHLAVPGFFQMAEVESFGYRS